MALAVVFLSFLSFLLHLRVFTQIAVIDCVFIHYHHYVSSHCHITLRSTNSQTAQVGLSTSILPTTISLSFARSTVTVRSGLSTSVSPTTFPQLAIVLDQTSKPVTPNANAKRLRLPPKPELSPPPERPEEVIEPTITSDCSEENLAIHSPPHLQTPTPIESSTMAGTPAEKQQRRAEEAARSNRIRTSLTSQTNNENDDYAEQNIDQQLLKAFEDLLDHQLTKEKYAAFLTNMEKEGYKHEDVSWDFTRWVATIYQKLIQDKDAEIEDLNGGIQVMDSDLADARNELEEQRNVVRAVIAGSRQTTPSTDFVAKATSKKFPDPSVWKSGTPSEWKQWKMSLRAKLRNNADWFSDEHARKDYFMKVVVDESWEIADRAILSRR